MECVTDQEICCKGVCVCEEFQILSLSIGDNARKIMIRDRAYQIVHLGELVQTGINARDASQRRQSLYMPLNG